jgi:hypothetical protein
MVFTWLSRESVTKYWYDNNVPQDSRNATPYGLLAADKLNRPDFAVPRLLAMSFRNN